jgi:hypothetical protein
MFRSRTFSKYLDLRGVRIIRAFHILLLAVLLANLAAPSAYSVASAQQAGSPWYEVRSIYTTEYGVNIPNGVAYSPRAKAFLLWKSGGDVSGIGMNETSVNTQGLNLPVEDAKNLAFNEYTNSLFVQSGANTQLEEFSVNNNGIPVASTGPRRRHNLRQLNLSQARGVTFDPDTGRMFVLNSRGNQVVILTPAAGGDYDGDTATRNNRVKRINLRALGYTDLRGIAYNPSDGNLYLLDAARQQVYEITQAGAKVSFFDLRSLQLSNPGSILFAPSGDTTDDPAEQSLFILEGTPATASSVSPQKSSGIKFAAPLLQTSTSGQIVELALVAPASLPSGTTLLPTSLVRIQDMSNAAWNPSSPDPSGIDYWPLTGRLLTSDSEVDEMPPYWVGKNVFGATLGGTLVNTCTTSPGFSNEPTGIAINPFNNRVYFSDDSGGGKIHEVNIGADGIYCTGDDTVTTIKFATDVEDVAYGNNTLYIAGGVDAEVFEFSLGPNGVLGGDDGAVTHWDTASLGFNDLEGIGFNADNGTVFIISTQGSDKYMGELTPAGVLLRAYDLTLMGSGANIRSDVAYAPSSQNSSVKSIYIVGRGVDNGSNPNENDGKWWEISLGGSIPTSTPTPTNTSGPTPTPTNTSTPTFTPTPTATPAPPIGASINPMYISLASNGTVGGVASADEDILLFNGTSWSLFFDGSDVGVSSLDAFGFSLLNPTTALFTFNAGITLGGVTYAPNDILRFDATSFGATTAGTFSMYLDGSDVGLDVTAENLDSVAVLPDGRILISTTGNPSVPGVTGNDEDVLAFTPTSLGDITSGTWEMYFDGSDVGLSTSSSEDIDALDVIEGNVYLSTLGAFSVTGATGANNDIFICFPTSLGANTACTFQSEHYFTGSTWGLGTNNIDAFNFLSFGPSPTNTPTPTDLPLDTPTFTPTPTGLPLDTPTFTPTPTGLPLDTPTFTPTPTGLPLDTPTFTPTPTGLPLDTPTFTPTNTPFDTPTFTPTSTPVQSSQSIYISLNGGGTVGGVAAEDVDIVYFDGTNWSQFFDSSDVGITTSGQDTDDFVIVDSSTLLLTFDTALTIGGMAVDPWDVVQFNATSLGSTTAGTFSMYLDGEDVGLDSAEGIIDALDLLPDGRVLISTSSNPSVPGVTGALDEDILAFTPTTLGDATSGTWAMYFDGSDVGLADSGGEDISGLYVAPNGDIYLSVTTSFAVTGVSGLNEDVFVCVPTSLGDVTACDYQPTLYFDGSVWALDSNAVDGIQIP